jgi:hypothetical protein
MAGLNSLVSDKDITTTTMPTWYSSATENVGKSLGNLQSPDMAATVAPSAINAFGASGPFATGQNTLQTIGAGAANPWLTSTDPTTGQTNVTPNMSTAMGGLFGAQKSYLDSIMGDIDTSATAPAIGGGGFGSKMNLAGIAKARGTAANDLFQKQMQAALTNQQTGVSAGAALGNLGNQQVQGAINTAQYQANEPYSSGLNEAKILQALGSNADKREVKQRDASLLNQLGGLSTALGGTGPVANLLTSLGLKGGLAGLGKSVLGSNYGNAANNTGSLFFDTGTGNMGDQEGDFDMYNPNNPTPSYDYDVENQFGGFYGNSSTPSYDYDVENQLGGFYGE